MRSTQDKVLAQIEQGAKDYGYELVTDFKFGNVGLARIESPAAFGPVLAFGFQFNTGSFDLYNIEPFLPEFPNSIREDSYKRTTQSMIVFSPAKEISADAVIKAIRNQLARARREENLKELEA